MTFYSAVVASDSLVECQVAWSLRRAGATSPCICPATWGILLLEAVPLVPVPLRTGALFSIDGSLVEQVSLLYEFVLLVAARVPTPICV